MKNQKCYRILETLKYCFSFEKSKIRIEPNKAAGDVKKRKHTVGEVGLWIREGRAKPLLEGQVTDRSHLFVLFLWLSTHLPTYRKFTQRCDVAVNLSTNIKIFQYIYLSNYRSIFRSVYISFRFLFHLSIYLAVGQACTFSISEPLNLQNVLRVTKVFFDISTSKKGPSMVCFVHFDLEICFAPQWRATFSPPLANFFFEFWSLKLSEKHSIWRFSHLFIHLYLLSSCSFSSTLLSSNFPVLSASSVLYFPSIHIVGNVILEYFNNKKIK